MKKKLLFSLIFGATIVSGVYGQTDSMKVALKSVDVITQRAKLYSSQARILKVIDQKEIQQMPVKTIDELLRTISGIDIRNRGVGNTQADVSIRGGSFDQVLILLNGVNITDPQTGHYNLDLPVDLSDIQKIEFLQGPAARIYGPNAFSGAINIVTKKVAGKSLNAKLEGGSFGTFGQNVSGSVGNDKLNTFASVSHKASKGYMANTDYDILNAFDQTQLDAGNAGNFSLQLAYQQKSYGANGFYTLAFPSQFDHTQTMYGALSWNLQVNKKTNLSAQLYSRMHYDRFELFRGMVGAPSWYTGHNYHLTNASGGKFTASYVDAFGKITAGVDIRNEHIYSTVLGTSMAQPVVNIFDKTINFTKASNRFLPTAFANYALNVGKFFVSAGASVTNSSQFGTFTSGGADVAYKPTDETRIYLSANSAVRLPTFTDLYYHGATQAANPNLQPEKSTTIEAGAKYNRNGLMLNGSVFYRMGNNIIDWVKNPSADSIIWRSRNLTEVNALGANVNAEYRFNSSILKNIGFSYSYLTMDKSAGDFISKYALDYLRNKAVLSIDHSIWSKLSANWEFSYNDRAGTYSDFQTGQATNYKTFVLANLRLAWTSEKYEIFADGNNLLNVSYADYGGLTQPGINFMAGVRLKLK